MVSLYDPPSLVNSHIVMPVGSNPDFTEVEEPFQCWDGDGFGANVPRILFY